MGSGLSSQYSNTVGSTEIEGVPKKPRHKNNKHSGFQGSNITDNAELVREKFGVSEDGYFAQKTKRAQIFKSADPVNDSIEFYEKLGTGGRKKNLANGHGTMITLDDETVITHRLVTKTPNSPAVDINIESANTYIKTQKIHFLLEK